MGRLKLNSIQIIFIICSILVSTNIVSSKLTAQTDSVCSTKDTCGSCIQEPGCTWCSKQDYTSQRCMTLATHLSNQCPQGQLLTPKTSVDIEIDEPLRKASSGREAVQIRPQKIRANLRVGEEVRFRLRYQQAQDYPIDLYYLMDLSASMEDDKQKLSTLASRLAKVMSNITDNFRLGFGSFVDKTAHPYINTSPGKVIRPCTLQSGKPCAPPYSYKHHLSLTSQHDLFEREVINAPVSGNLDTPEGGMDALVQVLVCSDLIGWRRKARKLILYATDSGFHMAGDGKLGGVVIKNDLKCHTDKSTGLYTHALEQDYPSISQINSLAKEHNVNIIFAVAGRSADIYSTLKDAIHGAAYGMLTRDSSNVVDLVRAEYDKIVDSVTLSDNSDEYISVKYYSRCNSSSGDMDQFGGELKETRECGGLKGREVVEFEIAVTAVRCPPGGSSSRIVDIKPQAVDESVTLDLQIACECDCERPGNGGFIENAKDCSGVGSSRCGVCQCPSNRHGRHCECDVSGGDTTGDISDDTSGCRPPGTNETEPLCSNHGACRCNKCSCHPRRDPTEIHYGTYCECDNFSCPRSATSFVVVGASDSSGTAGSASGSDTGATLSGTKAVCGGPSRGRCDCGRCKCLAGWTGEACECPVAKDGCVDPETGLICSGRGECICGRCECSTVPQTSTTPTSSDSAHKYSGKYCSECSSCPSLRCDELRHCVECKAYNTGKYADDGDKTCDDKCEFTPEILDVIVPEQESDDEYISPDKESLNPRKFCKVPDQSGCVIVFDYRFVSEPRTDTSIQSVIGLDSRKKLEVRAQKDKECGQPVDMLAVILGVVGSILVAGLVMLLIWKLLTSIHDKREYAKFEKERAQAKWSKNENPLYKPSTTTFHNPTFGRKSLHMK